MVTFVYSLCVSLSLSLSLSLSVGLGQSFLSDCCPLGCWCVGGDVLLARLDCSDQHGCRVSAWVMCRGQCKNAQKEGEKIGTKPCRWVLHSIFWGKFPEQELARTLRWPRWDGSNHTQGNKEKKPKATITGSPLVAAFLVLAVDRCNRQNTATIQQAFLESEQPRRAEWARVWINSDQHDFATAAPVDRYCDTCSKRKANPKKGRDSVSCYDCRVVPRIIAVIV